LISNREFSACFDMISVTNIVGHEKDTHTYTHKYSKMISASCLNKLNTLNFK